MSCCNFDNDILFDKIKDLEKNVKKFEKEQNKTNAEIYTLLKQSGVDLSQYYALNEEDYTKTLTSDDDVNTLEPGTYKIVKTDMPQNAPSGVASPEYDGTLLQSNSYALLFENGFDVCYRTKTSDETWTEWERVAFMSDLPSLTEYATQEWVNQQIQDIAGGSVTADWVKNNFLTIVYDNYSVIEANEDLNTYIKPGNYTCPTRVTAATIINSPTTYAFDLLVIDSIATDSKTQIIITSNNIFYYRTLYYNSWNKWERIVSDNDLNDMATQTWVQSQNYLTEIPDNYATDTEVTQAITAALVGYATQAWVNQQGFAKETDIPSLSGYATQTWVNQQGFLTEIPEEYITQTELQAQNYATQTWVTARGYQTSAQVDAAITEALNGYATQTWVNQQNFAHESDIPSLSGYATQTWVNNQNFATEEWVGQQGYQTVQQVKSLINTATADMVTQTDLDTLNYATENWVLQTALDGYATQAWVSGRGYATQTWVNNQSFAKTTIDDSLATRPSQEFERFMIRSTDYHGVNAVSGAEGYLVMHMAVDPDAPTKFIRSSGIVVNNTYVNTFTTSDKSSVGLATNNQGTVTVVGMSNNAKQMFILVKPDNID